MQLNYRKTKSGLYILKKEDFDDIASMALKEFQPNMLTKAQPLDVEDFICERLLLDMKTARLSEDGRILGVIAFDDTTYAGFDSFGRSIEIEMPVGTILLEESLVNDSRHVGRQRFTKMHEASHWICHRQYHVPLYGRNYEFRVKDDNRSIACRMERMRIRDVRTVHLGNGLILSGKNGRRIILLLLCLCRRQRLSVPPVRLWDLMGFKKQIVSIGRRI